jgi:hypothetical protein
MGMNRTSLRSTGLRQFSLFLRHLIALVVLVSAASLSLAAQPGAGVDAVLIMDSSGSMAKNDPHKLRVPAAKLFMSLLGGEDRIGLVSFSDNGYPVLHLTGPGPANQARILASADKVSSKGVYTNLYAALKKGAEMLEREGRPGQEQMLVLMSDGKMDVGDSDEDWQLTQRLQGELLKSLQEKHIKVYTIAFTEASDVELLQTVARESGALFKLAKNDTDLHEVFSDIFETAKSPDMLPIEGGEFSVDASIEEVTIVASKEREDVRLFLQSPQGRKYSSEDAGDMLKWFMSEHFDMITLRKPETGTWKLLFTGGRNRAYIVTNMTLNHNPQQPNLKTGENMVLESWLEQDGKLLDKEAVLTNTRFRMRIEAPDGASADFDLFDNGQFGDRKSVDGVYSNTLAYDNPGSYRIDLIAESATFTRQKTVHFEVRAPAEGEPPAAAPEAVETAKPEPVPGVLPEPAPEPEAEAPVEEPAAATPAEEPAPEPEPVKKKGMNLGLAIGVFVGVNLLLAGIGFGVWWFLKKRKQKSAVVEEESDDEQE